MSAQLDIFGAIANYLQRLKQGGRRSIYLSADSRAFIQSQLDENERLPKCEATASELQVDVEPTQFPKGDSVPMANAPTPAVSIKREPVIPPVAVAEPSGASVELSTVPTPVNEERSDGTAPVQEKTTNEATQSIAGSKRFEHKTNIVIPVKNVSDAGGMAETAVRVSGSSQPKIIFIGEEPHFSGEQQPFHGQEETMQKICAALKIPFEHVALVSVLRGLKVTPEVEAQCTGYLQQLLERLNPAVAVIMGRLPLRWLMGQDKSIAELRGKKFKYHQIYGMVTYHPSFYGVKARKREAWEDLQKVPGLLKRAEAKS